MSIIGFACPHCKSNVGLEHYNETACGAKLHPDYAAAVVHSDDDYYGHDQVSVTSGLGCPRSRAIERNCDVYVNPLAYNALLIGTAWDRAVGAYAPKGTSKIELVGTIEGITIHGEIDRVRTLEGHLTIEDWKHSNNFQEKHVKGQGVRKENQIQTSIYAELYAQQFGERPTRGAIWYHFSGAGKEPLVPFIYELLSLEECLQHKPYGGDYTVLDLYRQADSYYAGLKPFDLPLVGETMSFGTKSYCDYCQVRDACFEAARGAPF